MWVPVRVRAPSLALDTDSTSAQAAELTELARPSIALTESEAGVVIGPQTSSGERAGGRNLSSGRPSWLRRLTSGRREDSSRSPERQGAFGADAKTAARAAVSQSSGAGSLNYAVRTDDDGVEVPDEQSVHSSNLGADAHRSDSRCAALGYTEARWGPVPSSPALTGQSGSLGDGEPRDGALCFPGVRRAVGGSPLSTTGAPIGAELGAGLSRERSLHAGRVVATRSNTVIGLDGLLTGRSQSPHSRHGGTHRGLGSPSTATEANPRSSGAPPLRFLSSSKSGSRHRSSQGSPADTPTASGFEQAIGNGSRDVVEDATVAEALHPSPAGSTPEGAASPAGRSRVVSASMTVRSKSRAQRDVRRVARAKARAQHSNSSLAAQRAPDEGATWGSIQSMPSTALPSSGALTTPSTPARSLSSSGGCGAAADSLLGEFGDLGSRAACLVVEDNDSQRLGLCRLLRRLGLECSQAADGQAGLDKLVELCSSSVLGANGGAVEYDTSPPLGDAAESRTLAQSVPPSAPRRAVLPASSPDQAPALRRSSSAMALTSVFGSNDGKLPSPSAAEREGRGGAEGLPGMEAIEGERRPRGIASAARQRRRRLIVWTDCRMPRLSGPELVAAASTLPSVLSHGQVTFVGTTGSAEDEGAFSLAGAKFVLAKPLEFASVVSVLRQILRDDAHPAS